MNVSVAELFLAYRQAKISIHQEHQGPWRLAWARAELDLPAILARMRQQLSLSPGWFSGLSPGPVWLLPKKAESRKNSSGVTRIGGSFRSPLASLTVRPHVTPSIQFAIVEVLWLWRFGAALEALLGREARGNRLKLLDNQTQFNKDALGCFKFWPVAYRRFREDGFAVARSLLSAKRGRCLLATFDLTSYYDEIDPGFLVSGSFTDQVAATSASRGIDFDRSEYVSATRTLLGAFNRYRQACRRVTGIAVDRGIPIGCLTSKLISNLALASLDDHVRAQPSVRYYARYVDDILLVAEASSSTPLTASAIAKAYLPLAANGPKRSSELSLDTTKLERKGSRFHLQSSKLRGYMLIGRRGRDFLDTVERDVKLIASERRAFLLPDGLGSESPLTALFVGTDSDSPVQVLREVDRLKVERYAASVAVSKTAVGVELLSPPDSARWCRRQLAPLAAHITSPDQWLEFIDLALRALTVCIRAGDTSTARAIVRRHTANFEVLDSNRPTNPVTWNSRVVRWSRVRTGLRAWYESRRFEEIAASLPIEALVADTVPSILKGILGRPLRLGTRVIGSAAVLNGARLLRSADLRTVDRETDLQGLPSTNLWNSPGRWGRLSATLRDHALTTERSAGVQNFIEACRRLDDATYRDQSPVDVLLMTRPPTQFDIACRWAKARRPMESLSTVTNAVRGTRYSNSVIRQPDPDSLDVTTGALYLRGRLEDLQLVLGNLSTDLAWFEAAAKGTPTVTRGRMAGIGRIVNEAIRARHKSKRPTLLVLPELSLPKRLLRAMAHRLLGEEVNLVAGLEYSAGPSGVINEAVGVFAPGFKVAAVCWWPKTLPARGEFQELRKLGLSFTEYSESPMVINTDFGTVSTLICSELLDVKRRAELLGRIDFLIVPSWNKDTATFDHTIQTTANDLHAYVAVANNALYSDCRVQIPSDERYLRDACRLIARRQNTVIVTSLSAEELRRFQLASLAQPEVQMKGFKPLPPGYVFRRK